MSQVIVEPLIGPYGLGEGPHWDDKSQKLYFVDIFAQKIFRFDPETHDLTSAYIGNYILYYSIVYSMFLIISIYL